MFEKYIDTIKNGTFSLDQGSLSNDLLIDESGDLSIFYAPFDHINVDAKIVICGITPGFQQAILALKEASQQFNVRSFLI